MKDNVSNEVEMHRLNLLHYFDHINIYLNSSKHFFRSVVVLANLPTSSVDKWLEMMM